MGSSDWFCWVEQVFEWASSTPVKINPKSRSLRGHQRRIIISQLIRNTCRQLKRASPTSELSINIPNLKDVIARRSPKVILTPFEVSYTAEQLLHSNSSVVCQRHFTLFQLKKVSSHRAVTVPSINLYCMLVQSRAATENRPVHLEPVISRVCNRESYQVRQHVCRFAIEMWHAGLPTRPAQISAGFDASRSAVSFSGFRDRKNWVRFVQLI